jgi:hypothetical protein
MKLLLDTNVFIEAIFKQRQAFVAQKLLATRQHELFISIFSLHSIGIILMRNGRESRWPRFLKDMIASGRVKVLTLQTDDLAKVPATARQFSLDFDDAFQYVVAETNGLSIISFDSDFDATPLGRQMPQAVI